VAVGHGGLQSLKHLGAAQHGGIRGHGHGPVIGPAIARRHDAQLGNGEIAHHPGARADILAHLRTHQNEDRCGLIHRGRRRAVLAHIRLRCAHRRPSFRECAVLDPGATSVHHRFARGPSPKARSAGF
jgi:hypothetical protein